MYKNIFLFNAIIFSVMVCKGMNDVDGKDAILQTLKRERNEFAEMIHNKFLDPEQELKRIDQHFSFYKEKLAQEKQACLLKIKQKYDISDDMWDICIKDQAEFNKTIKEAINVYAPDGQHDAVLSDQHKRILAHALNRYGFDYKKINIKESTNKCCIALKCSVNYTVIGTTYTIGDSEDKKKVMINVRVNKPTIKINPLLLAHSAASKGMLASIAWSFAHITCDSFPYSLSRVLCGRYSIEALRESREYRDLMKLNDYYAEFFLGLEDYKLCKWKVQEKLITSKEIDLNNDYFQKLCTIHSLWKKRKMLQECMDSNK